MKLLILTSNDTFAGILLYKLFKLYNHKIAYIFLQKRPMRKKNSIALWWSVAKISGLRYSTYLALESILYQVATRIRQIVGLNKEPHNYLATPKHLSKKFHIPFCYVNDIHDTQILERIKTIRPDLIISARFSQIIKESLLSIPSYGIINFHASLLPQYAGLGSVFQAMRHNEPTVGVTIHFMDKKIDTGHIILQTQLPIKSKDSVSRVSLNAHIRSAKLLAQAISEVQKEKTYPPSNKQVASRFSWPQKKEIAQFKKQGKKLMAPKDVFYLLTQFSYE